MSKLTFVKQEKKQTDFGNMLAQQIGTVPF